MNVSSRNNILLKNWFKLMINDNYIFHLKSMMIKKILIKTILKIFYSFYWIINICIGDVYWCCQLRDSSNIVGSLLRRHSISICIFRLLSVISFMFIITTYDDKTKNANYVWEFLQYFTITRTNIKRKLTSKHLNIFLLKKHIIITFIFIFSYTNSYKP